jgi:hypothetical protein
MMRTPNNIVKRVLSLFLVFCLDSNLSSSIVQIGSLRPESFVYQALLLFEFFTVRIAWLQLFSS